MEENTVQKGRGANEYILDVCMRLRLPLVTRTTAQIIYQHSVDKLDCKPAPRKLAHGALFLSSKITESRVGSEAYVAASGMQLDYALEISIIEHLKFNFDFFDVYSFVVNVCRDFGFVESQKTAKLDGIYGDRRLSRIGFLGSGYSVRSACLAVFEEEEINLITGVYCIKADMEEIRRMKEEFFTEGREE